MSFMAARTQKTGRGLNRVEDEKKYVTQPRGREGKVQGQSTGRKAELKAPKT